MTTLQGRFAAVINEHKARGRSHLESMVRAYEADPPTDPDFNALDKIKRLEQYQTNATVSRTVALAATLAADAEAVAALLVPEEDRSATLAELEVDRWPILASPTGPHGWFMDHWVRGIPGFRGACGTAFYPRETLSKIRFAIYESHPHEDAFSYGDDGKWPPPDALGLNADSLPPESTRPWMSQSGALLVTDAYWRVRPELGALWKLKELAMGDLPGSGHADAARHALQASGAEEDPDILKAIAGEVHTHAGYLFRRLEDARAELADTGAGLLHADGLAADYLAELGGITTADAIREDARARLGRAGALDLWRLWRPEQDGQPCSRLLWNERRPGGVTPSCDNHGAPPILLSLALVLYQHRSAAVPMRTRFIEVGEDHFTALPKPISATSWAMGAPGVELDGDCFSATPRPLLVPRAYGTDLLPGSPVAHQCDLMLERAENIPVAIDTASKAGLVLSVGASKVLVYLAAALEWDGRRCETTLGGLTQFIRQNKRNFKRSCESIAGDLEQLDSLRLWFPDGTSTPIFAMRRPTISTDPSQILWASYNPSTVDLFGGDMGPSVGRRLNGRFIINLSGVMRIPGTKPGALRQYLRAASSWNDAGADPKRVRRYPLPQWAALVNSLSPAAVAYCTAGAGSTRRRSLSADLATVRKDAEWLADNGLAILELQGPQGNRRQIRLLPTKQHAEAAAKLQRERPKKGK